MKNLLIIPALFFSCSIQGAEVEADKKEMMEFFLSEEDDAAVGKELQELFENNKNKINRVAEHQVKVLVIRNQKVFQEWNIQVGADTEISEINDIVAVLAGNLDIDKYNLQLCLSSGGKWYATLQLSEGDEHHPKLLSNYLPVDLVKKLKGLSYENEYDFWFKLVDMDKLDK